MTKNEKTARGCALKIGDDYIPRWWCPHNFLSNRGTEFISQVSRAVYETLEAVNKFPSSYHPQTNVMVDRLNHTLCQMLSYLIADNQRNWDDMLMHAVAAYDNNVSRGTGLAPNEVHIGRYPRLPMTTLQGRGIKGHQGLKQDQLDSLELMRNRQVKAYLVQIQEEDGLIKARHEANNEHLAELVNRRPKFEVGDWVWVHDDKSIITGGGKHVLKNFRSKKFA